LEAGPFTDVHDECVKYDLLQAAATWNLESDDEPPHHCWTEQWRLRARLPIGGVVKTLHIKFHM
jgi:hypothetical protein